MHKITESFRTSIIATHGDLGRAWLERLPEIIEYCEQRWAIELEEPFSELSHNYVAPAILAGGTQVVCKLGIPVIALHQEIAALKLFNGKGSAKLLDADANKGILIVERLIPGERMKSFLDDINTIEPTCNAILELWRSPPQDPQHFAVIEKWLQGYTQISKKLQNGLGDYPQQLIELAVNAAQQLLQQQPDPVFMHGDLHHYNILSATRSPWLIIDPRGAIGDPCYEVSAIFRNFTPEIIDNPKCNEVLLERVHKFAEHLQLDESRLQAWCFCQLNLAAMLHYDSQLTGYESLRDAAITLSTGLAK